MPKTPRSRRAQHDADRAYAQMWDAYVHSARADIEAYAEAYDAAAHEAREQAEQAQRAAQAAKAGSPKPPADNAE